MMEIKTEGTISGSKILEHTGEDLEDMLAEKIAEGIKQELMKNINDMPFIEVDPTPEGDGSVVWTASLVLCSQDQMISSIGIMAKRLVEKFGASPEDIEYCLESAATDMKGW